MTTFNDVSETAREYRELPQQLAPTIARLPALADQAQSTLNAFSAFAADANRLTKSLQAPGGPIDRVSSTVDRVGLSLEAVTSGVELDALPHVISLTDETRSSMRALKNTMNKLNDRPQSILFGAPGTPPGPGEEGFTAPSK